MEFISSISTLGLLLAALLVLSLAEALAPLHSKNAWSRRHLGPNLTLTLIAVATSLLFNIPLLLGLAFLQRQGWGLFNLIDAPAAVEAAGAVLILDLAWYVTHRSLHHAPALWRLHAIHHSDPMVDVTTAVRQHPGESLIRYLYLAAFAFAAGVSPGGFALYRAWSALHGQFEHANLQLPPWIDRTMAAVFTSPNLHKVHHARERVFTDTNYGNIFSIWDRLFGTFTPPDQGRAVTYGLDGEDEPSRQSVSALLSSPWRERARWSAAPGGTPAAAGGEPDDG